MVKSDIDEFIRQRRAKCDHELQKSVGERNMYPEGTDAQLAFDCLIELFLGKDWYVVDPIHTAQVNTIALDEILYRHCRRYRKLCRKNNKPKNK